MRRQEAEPGVPHGSTVGTSATNEPHSGRWLLAALLIYAVPALAANWPAFPGDGTLLRQGDLTEMSWFLAWTPHALHHLQNPFYTTWLNFPAGLDLLQNTQVALLGLLAAPLTLTAGPVASVNLLLWLAFPLSAGAMFVLARRWLSSPLAALAAGALYGFSPYMIGQGAAHLHLIFVPLPPLILLALGEALTGKRRWGAALGALTVAQFFISAEVLATTAIVAVLALVVVAAVRPAAVRPAARQGIVPISLALSIAAVCLAYPVWVMVAGPYHYGGPAFSGGLSADLLGAVIPTSSQLVAPFSTLGDRLLGGNIIENGSYLGVPMLVVLLMLSVRFWPSVHTRVCAVMVLICFVLSLGSHLIVNNVDTGLPLPFAVLQNAPLLGSMLAVRISLLWTSSRRSWWVSVSTLLFATGGATSRLAQGKIGPSWWCAGHSRGASRGVPASAWPPPWGWSAGSRAGRIRPHPRRSPPTSAQPQWTTLRRATWP